MSTARACLQDCFDDLRSALDLAIISVNSTSEPQDEVLKFISETKKVEKVSRKGISNLGRKTWMEKVEANQETLCGLCFDGRIQIRYFQFDSSVAHRLTKNFEIGN